MYYFKGSSLSEMRKAMEASRGSDLGFIHGLSTNNQLN
jgi:hypothetical protein